MGKHAILVEDGKRLTIRYTESGTGQKKLLRLSGVEFIRRFLQHVLPKGFRRVRTYGWLSPAAHKRFARIQALLESLLLISQNGTSIQAIPAMRNTKIPKTSPSMKRICAGKSFRV